MRSHKQSGTLTAASELGDDQHAAAISRASSLPAYAAQENHRNVSQRTQRLEVVALPPTDRFVLAAHMVERVSTVATLGNTLFVTPLAEFPFTQAKEGGAIYLGVVADEVVQSGMERAAIGL
jgi:hypothetical protein